VRALRTIDEPSELQRLGHLLVSLTWRDLRVRYKQSVLGVAWAVVLPLSMMLVFTFVFTRAVNVTAVLGIAMPYALFAYTGLVPWTFFSSGLNGCVNSLVANRNLVTKVYFPREVFPLSCVAGAFVDFCIAMTVLVVLMAYFHARGTWAFVVHPQLFFQPVVVVVQIALTVGLGMMLAMANLFYRDVRQVVGVVLQLGMFVSAVVVPAPQNDSLLTHTIAMNPLVPIITAYRDCILHGRWPDPAGFLYASAVAAVAIAGGWICFRRASYRFAECI
jgi:ABC-type polysaccharide/polyol phosphate export permease